MVLHHGALKHWFTEVVAIRLKDQRLHEIALSGRWSISRTQTFESLDTRQCRMGMWTAHWLRRHLRHIFLVHIHVFSVSFRRSKANLSRQPQCQKREFSFLGFSPRVRTEDESRAHQHTSSISTSPPALGPRSARKVRPNNSFSISKQMPLSAASYRPLLNSSRMKACCAHAGS